MSRVHNKDRKEQEKSGDPTIKMHPGHRGVALLGHLMKRRSSSAKIQRNVSRKG